MPYNMEIVLLWRHFTLCVNWNRSKPSGMMQQTRLNMPQKVFRLRRLHAEHRCGLLLQMTHVAWSVSVCVGRKGELCKKRLIWSRCRLGGGQTRVSPMNYNRWADGIQISHGKGHFSGDACQSIVTYLCMSAFRIVRLPPLANVPASWRDGRIHRPPRGLTKRRCGFLPHYFGRLFALDATTCRNMMNPVWWLLSA